MPSPHTWRPICPRATTKNESVSPPARRESSDSSASPNTSKPNRVKVSSACLSCKHKKCRCDGLHPCLNCFTHQLECKYDETRDMRRNRVSRNVSESLANRVGSITADNDSLSSRVKDLTAQVETLTTELGRTSLYQRLLDALSRIDDQTAIVLLARLRGYREGVGPDDDDPLLSAAFLTLGTESSLTGLLETENSPTALSMGASWHDESFSVDAAPY